MVRSTLCASFSSRSVTGMTPSAPVRCSQVSVMRRLVGVGAADIACGTRITEPSLVMVRPEAVGTF